MECHLAGLLVTGRKKVSLNRVRGLPKQDANSVPPKYNTIIDGELLPLKRDRYHSPFVRDFLLRFQPLRRRRLPRPAGNY
eukprot:scaffold3498_cov176-Amphora_coffeaeformis.AAC.13